MHRKKNGVRVLFVVMTAGAVLLAACGGGKPTKIAATATTVESTTTTTAVVETTTTAVGAPATTAAPTTTAAVKAATVTTAAPVAVKPIKVKFLPATESLAVLTQLQAIAKDYFKQEGIDLNYLGVLANAAQAAQTVVTGQADIAGTGSTGVLTVLSANRDIVSIALISKEPTTIISMTNKAAAEVAKKGITASSPIQAKMDALKGLKLGLPAAGSSTDILVRTTLKDYGIDANKDLEIVPVNDGPGLAAAARQNRVDAYAFSPPDSVLGVAEGWGQIWVSYPSGEVKQFQGMPLTDIVTSRKYYQQNPEAVRRVLRALWRAAEDIRTNPEMVRKAVKDRWFKDLDAAVYNASFDALLPGFQRGLIPEKPGFDILLKTFNLSRSQPVDLAFSDVYDSTLVQATKP
jgi:NitT/TauT family transport system substrate-binding protein